MRTKTLLIAAAALAVGVISSEAQVYSQNIVGYANVQLNPGFNFLSNPLDTQDGTGAINDAATNVFANPFNSGLGYGPMDGNKLLLWTGTTFSTFVFDSNPGDTTTGFTDNNGNPLPCPVLSAGVGFYVDNLSAKATNTIVGVVRGVTSTSISNTVVISSQAFSMIGSATPLAGDMVTNLMLSNVYNSGLGYGPIDGCKILTPNYNGAGILTSYTSYVFDSNPGDTSTGFTDNNGNPLPAPTFTVGEGIFFNNTLGSAVTWTQNVTNN